MCYEEYGTYCDSEHGFAASPFFRDDTRLRALRFLDHMLVNTSFSI